MERHWKIIFTDRVSPQAQNLGQGESLQLKVHASTSHCQVKLKKCPALLCSIEKQNENEPPARNFLESAKRSHHTHREFCWMPQPKTSTDQTALIFRSAKKMETETRIEGKHLKLSEEVQERLFCFSYTFLENQLYTNVSFFTLAPQHPRMKLCFGSVTAWHLFHRSGFYQEHQCFLGKTGSGYPFRLVKDDEVLHYES